MTQKSNSANNYNFLKIPKHIAIIMDGNARWAKKNNLNLFSGHKRGVENIKEISQAAIDFGVSYLTLYAFSSENWQRSKAEIDNLLKLLNDYLEKNIQPLLDSDIKINVFGDLNKIPAKILKKIKKAEEETSNNKSLVLNVAFSYGARQEIIEATKKIAFDFANNQIDLASIDEKLFSSKLYNPNLPDPDLLIRTAGDLRVSNFLLWQIAYSELFFTDVFWPDFNKLGLKEAIIEFNNRERRYGKR